jgi:hypothetical protein
MLINEIRAHLSQEFLAYPYSTELDKCRARQIESLLTVIDETLKLLIKLVSKFKNSKSNENFRFYIDLMFRNSVCSIQKLIKEPFSHFPDVTLWLLAGGEPVGVCVLHAHDLIWSMDPKKRGRMSGKLFYTDVKSLAAVDLANPELENTARVRLYAWLGGFDEKGHLFEPGSLPFGFDVLETNEFGLPVQLLYRGELKTSIVHTVNPRCPVLS